MSPVSASPVSAASSRFVAAHLDAARSLGERLIPLVGRPDTFAAELRAGFASLSDPVYAAGVRSVTPGLGPVFGVRQPLMEAAHRAFKKGTRTAPKFVNQAWTLYPHFFSPREEAGIEWRLRALG